MSLTADSAPSSRRGSALLRLRRNKAPSNVSSQSLNTSSTDGDDASEIGRRASVETRKSVDERAGTEDSPSKGLSSLISRKKRKPKQDQAQEIPRENSADSGPRSQSISGHASESSLLYDESGHSSLLTDDNSEAEGSPTRPSLSPRESHTGYLTLSSPEINARTTPAILLSEHPTQPESAAASHSSTKIPQTLDSSTTTEALQSPAAAQRSPSPADKLRGAFALTYKKEAAERESVDASTSGSGVLRALFKPSSRRNSLDSRPPSSSLRTSETENAQTEESLLSEKPRPETPQGRGRQPIDTKFPPATPPNLVETPTTVVTPPTPTNLNGEFSKNSVFAVQKGSPRKLSSVDSIKHRRAQSSTSTIPSKLSTSINPPLTPTVEETKTPGGTLTQPVNATGFFSSFFTSAQKAADQFSNSIGTSASSIQKKSVNNQRPATSGGELVIPGSESRSDAELGKGSEKKELAIDTLGKGNLSLSHLGISESPNTVSMSTSNLPPPISLDQNGESSRKVEEEAAARAVSSAYEKPIAAVVSQAAGRPPSVTSNDRLTLQGDQSPPRNGVEADSSTIRRTASVKSKISGRRKHRGSSATAATDHSIAAAIKSSAAGLANPSINGVGHRLTGFAVASSKRNKDFHQLFRSVPEDDYLIEDYSAALQRDILLHGRLYVSEGHVCFSSNILGWVTNLVISFDEVVSVEKKSTAVIFPNAIVISTLQARNTFASFVARDSTYELLIGIWKISHPNLKSSLNGVVLDNAGTGDKTEVADPEGPEDSLDGTEDEVYDEDDEDDVGSFTDAGVAPSVAGSELGDHTLSRKVSGALLSAQTPTAGAAPKGPDTIDTPVPVAASGNDFPGPVAHEPTECSDTATHYERPLNDTTIPAPLGKVYSMMFGPASGTFMRKWLVETQKSRDLNFVDDRTGLDNDHKTFAYDYIKPLNVPVGPRQTQCLTTTTLTAFDLEKAVSVDCSTQTPDVPSGNVFTTKTRYCLMWGPANSTRLVASCTIEWTGKSWLKGTIEKGANDGQIEYVKSLVAAIKAGLAAKPVVAKGPKKGKRRGKKDSADADDIAAQPVVVVEQKRADWGAFEPVRFLLEPIVSLLRPFITSQVIIAVLFALLTYTWFLAPGGGRSPGVGFSGSSSPARIAAYEEIWQREEGALWDWLEDRTGMHGGAHGAPLDEQQKRRQQILSARQMGDNIQDERMTERQMDDAIRTTEERLVALKEAVGRKKGKGKEDA